MMLNGNGALDTSTHRLLNRVRDEIASHRLEPVPAHESEAPTAEMRSQRSAQPPRATPTPRYPQV